MIDITKERAENERWKPIRGFEEYEVSTIGRVRRLTYRNRYNFYRLETPRILKQSVNTSGYYFVSLCLDGKRHLSRVNRLVLETFSGPPQIPGMHAAHENGIKTDNRIENLSWKTNKENVHDMIRHGTIRRGESHPAHQLTDNDVRNIRRAISSGVSAKRTGVRFGVSDTVIRNIIKGKSWSHVI